MASKLGLGRGMAALLPDEEDSASLIPAAQKAEQKTSGDVGVEFITLAKITANPDQPRKNFDPVELAELADSIREHGIIQPVIVEENAKGAFIIVAGERRVRAAKIAGLTEVPVIVRKYSDEKRMVVSLIENVQRSDLNPIEEAAAYKRLMELTGLSQDETASRVGKNRSTVANALRLLRLRQEVQESIRKGELSAGHARAILSVPGVKIQDTLFREIIRKDLSVREAEKMAALLNGQNKKSKNDGSHTPVHFPELDDMEEKFIKHLGTKVKIKGDLNSGTIEIDYYSMDDLDRLYELLG